MKTLNLVATITAGILISSLATSAHAEGDCRPGHDAHKKKEARAHWEKKEREKKREKEECAAREREEKKASCA